MVKSTPRLASVRRADQAARALPSLPVARCRSEGPFKSTTKAVARNPNGEAAPRSTGTVRSAVVVLRGTASNHATNPLPRASRAATGAWKGLLPVATSMTWGASQVPSAR